MRRPRGRTGVAGEAHPPLWAVIPGLAHLLRGSRRRGGHLLGVFMLFAAILVIRWDQFLRALESTDIGAKVAAWTLLGGLAATVGASLWDARRLGDGGLPPAPGGNPGVGVIAGTTEMAAGDPGETPEDASSGPTVPGPPSGPVLETAGGTLQAGPPPWFGGEASTAGARAKSPLRMAARRFAANRLAVAALYVILLLYLFGALAPILAPHDPVAIENALQNRYLPPSLEHPFGTDEFGRDLFSRALYGARISLSVGLLAVLVAVSVGTVYGAVSAYFGGMVDNVLMRIVDVVMAFPTFFLMLMLVGIFEAEIFFLVLILGLTSWTGTARYVRGEILSLKEREFIESARAIGLPHRLILFRHLIPNALSPVLVSAALMVGGMVGAEAGLSFLGIGIRPPTPSWGNMISQGQDALLVAWWVAFFPGSLLAVTILSFNLLADGLRDSLDPKTLMRKYV